MNRGWPNIVIDTISFQKKKERKNKVQLPKIRFHDRGGGSIEEASLSASTLRAPLRPACLSRCNGSIAMNAVVRYYVEPPSAGKDNLIPISRRGGTRRGEGRALSRLYRASTIPISRYHRSWTATLNPGSGLSPLRQSGSCSFVISKFTCPFTISVVRWARDFSSPFFFSLSLSLFSFRRLGRTKYGLWEVFVHLWILMI